MSMFLRSTTTTICNSRGGIATRIVMAIVTLVVAGVFIVVLLSKNEQKQKFHYANALTIAEYGLSEALMKLGENRNWRDGFTDIAYNEGTYTVTLNTETSGDTVLLIVESTGQSATVKRKKEIIFRLTVSQDGDSAWQQHSAQ